MINVEIGSLDKRIHILKHTETTDEYGLTHQGYTDAIGNSVWARIEPAWQNVLRTVSGQNRIHHKDNYPLPQGY